MTCCFRDSERERCCLLSMTVEFHVTWNQFFSSVTEFKWGLPVFYRHYSNRSVFESLQCLSRAMSCSQAQFKSAFLPFADLPPIQSQTKSGAFVNGRSRARYGLQGMCALHVCACSLPIGCYADVSGQVYAVSELNETRSA